MLRSFFYLIDEQDFNTTAFDITMPADEGEPTYVLNIPIPIVDDEINERKEQYFIVRFEVIDAINPNAIHIDQDVAMVAIVDNDGKY